MSVGSKRTALALAASAVILLFALRGNRASHPTPTPAPGAPNETVSEPPRATITTIDEGPSAPPPDVPRALRDTTPDGRLSSDASGHFLVDAEAKRFFDYFLLSEGEESDSAIEERVTSAIAARLRDPARAEAIDTFQTYLRYRRAGAVARFADKEPAARVADLRRLRRDFFGRNASAFFAHEEALEDRVLREMAIAPEAREKGPTTFDSQGSESSAAVVQLVQRDQAFKALAPEERRAERAKAFGPEIAARLAKMDEEDDAWGQRMDKYFAARAEILADTTSPEGAHERRLEALRESSFTESERVRIPVLERLHDRKR